MSRLGMINGCPKERIKPPPPKKTPRDPLANLLGRVPVKLPKGPRRKK